VSKPPPPNGQIATASIAEALDKVTAEMLRVATERRAHDARVAANIAAKLAAEWQREQARPAPPQRRPGEGEVPAERFGPADRRVGSERK